MLQCLSANHSVLGGNAGRRMKPLTNKAQDLAGKAVW
jgi:hypothetical protein